MANTKCVICYQKKGKRYCPVLKGKICSSCCAREMAEENICLSSCKYRASSLQYKKHKEQSKYQVKLGNLNIDKEHVMRFVAVLESRICEKVVQDLYYEDQHIVKAIERVIDQYQFGMVSKEVLLNRIGIIESVIIEEIGSFALESAGGLSKEMILEYMKLYQRFLINFLQGKSGSRPYIQYLIEIREQTQERKEKTSLII